MENRIVDLWLKDRSITAPAIQRRLDDEGISAPSHRTIRGILAKRQPSVPADLPPEEAEPWSFTDTDMTPEDAGVVVRALAEWRRDAEEMLADVGRMPTATGMVVVDGRYGPTKAQAGWVVRIRRAAPTLPAYLAFGLAHDFAVAEAADADTWAMQSDLVRWIAENDIQPTPQWLRDLRGLREASELAAIVDQQEDRS